jgi:hypothetical protein
MIGQFTAKAVIVSMTVWIEARSWAPSATGVQFPRRPLSLDISEINTSATIIKSV